MATTDERVGYLEQQVSAVVAKVDMIIEEMHDMRREMRDRDNQRAAEIQAAREKHDADMKELREKHDADMKELREDMKELRKDIKGALQNIQGLTIASMVGIAAIAVGVLGFLWSTARNMNSQPPPPAQYQSTLPAR